MFDRTVIGFDTETHLITLGRLAPPVVCLTLAGSGGPPALPIGAVVERPSGDEWAALVVGRRAIVDAWTELLASGAVLVAHNAPFDLAVLVEAAALEGVDLHRATFDALDDGRIRDTKIREQLLAIEGGWFDFDHLVTQRAPTFSLAEVVLRRFGVDLSAEKTDPGAWRLRYAELRDVPAHAWPEGARSYAIDDARWAVRAAVDQCRARPLRGGGGEILVDEHGTITDEIDQVRAAYALHLLSCWGLRTDRAAAATWEAVVREHVATAEKIARDAGFVRVKNHWRRSRDSVDGKAGTCRVCGAGPYATAPTCPACGVEGETSKDLAALRARVETAYTSRGGEPPRTDKGAIATDREALEESGDPILAEFAALGVYAKNLSTHVPRLAAGFEHAACYGYNVLVRSGRTSGSTQQPPRGGDYRACHVPRRGWVYCSVDYDIAELKALAQTHLDWFGHSALADAINAGEDPHLSFGARLLAANGATPPAGFSSWTYAAIKSVPKDKSHPLYDAVHGPKGARQLAKIANFGFPGGLGASAFVAYAKGYGVDLEPAEGDDLKRLWLEQWREQRAYFDTIARCTESGSFTLVQAISGRQRGACAFTQACNGYFQGRVADLAKRALYEVQRAAYSAPASPLYGVRPVLFVHDEVIAEIPAPWLYPGEETDAPSWTPEQTTAAADELAHVMVKVERQYLPDVRPSASPALMLRWYKGADTIRRDDILYPWSP